jgi:hypothetical protein
MNKEIYTTLADFLVVVVVVVVVGQSKPYGAIESSSQVSSEISKLPPMYCLKPSTSNSFHSLSAAGKVNNSVSKLSVSATSQLVEVLKTSKVVEFYVTLTPSAPKKLTAYKVQVVFTVAISAAAIV